MIKPHNSAKKQGDKSSPCFYVPVIVYLRSYSSFTVMDAVLFLELVSKAPS